MAKQLLDDDLWKLIEPILPPPKRRRFRHPGRKPIDNRQALNGILFVLKTGIPWEYLPQEMGCGSGMTCWRRLHDWQRRGVWQQLHQVLLDKLREADKIDWSRAVVDSTSVRAVLGGADRPESDGSTEKWGQTSCSYRRPWHSDGRHVDGRQPT